MGSSERQAWLWNEVLWIDPLMRTLLAEMCFQNLWVAFTQLIPQILRSKALLKDTILCVSPPVLLLRIHNICACVLLCFALTATIVVHSSVPVLLGSMTCSQ